LAYRGDFALATLVRFLPIVTQIFLWGAIYGAFSDKPRGNLYGYSYGDMVAYSLLVMLGRAFSSMPGLTGGIARDIRDGTIKKFLTQPVDMFDYLFWHRAQGRVLHRGNGAVCARLLVVPRLFPRMARCSHTLRGGGVTHPGISHRLLH
jgi:ABC-2 type transport system permease protein